MTPSTSQGGERKQSKSAQLGRRAQHQFEIDTHNSEAVCKPLTRFGFSILLPKTNKEVLHLVARKEGMEGRKEGMEGRKEGMEGRREEGREGRKEWREGGRKGGRDGGQEERREKKSLHALNYVTL
jgi:hypothetical protein